MKSPIQDYLLEVLDDLRDDNGGETAQYILELAQADPDLFAAAITSTTGATYSAGDTDAEFSIQSISKPFAYAAALMDRGLEQVLDSVGVEPSGEAFNELSLEGGTHRPKNPMINAGAITTHALLVGPEADQEARVERVLRFFSRLAGRPLQVDETVCASELADADRNLAIAHMLRTYGVLTSDPHDVVEGYTRQCSILVSVRDLSMMSATLATGGIQPVTGERLMAPEVARQVMAVMASAGMYDAAGDWLTQVGIPAKSGVAGGMVGVLPNQVGIGTFSPRLDAHGNSRRGSEVFARLSRDVGMHLFAPGEGRLDAISSHGDEKHIVLAAQGTVQFTAAAELLDLMTTAGPESIVELDVSAAHAFTDVGRRMTLEGLRRLRLEGHRVRLRDPAAVLPDPDLGDGSVPESV